MFALAFTFSSPTVAKWKQQIEALRSELINPSHEMTVLLDAIREDIDKQFDENQGKWQKLAAYTVEKKERINADPRILHETKEGAGRRLRDAYLEAGRVTSQGKIEFSYPTDKPYAKEHQEGVVDPRKPIKPKRKRGISPKRLQKFSDELDDEFFDRFGRH